jgi:negative regulator of sigma E activity
VDIMNPQATSPDLPLTGQTRALPPGEAEALSAWFDGESDSVHSLERALHDPGARRHFESWCVVADALRSHEVAAAHCPALRDRVMAALAAEPRLLAPRALRPRRWQRAAGAATAVAAAAAVLMLVALPQVRNGLGAGGPATVASANAAGASTATPLLASAPRAAVPGSSPAAEASLDAYLAAHHNLAPSAVMPAAATYLRYGDEPAR